MLGTDSWSGSPDRGLRQRAIRRGAKKDQGAGYLVRRRARKADAPSAALQLVHSP